MGRRLVCALLALIALPAAAALDMSYSFHDAKHNESVLFALSARQLNAELFRASCAECDAKDTYTRYSVSAEQAFDISGGYRVDEDGAEEIDVAVRLRPTLSSELSHAPPLTSTAQQWTLHFAFCKLQVLECRQFSTRFEECHHSVELKGVWLETGGNTSVRWKQVDAEAMEGAGILVAAEDDEWDLTSTGAFGCTSSRLRLYAAAAVEDTDAPPTADASSAPKRDEITLFFSELTVQMRVLVRTSYHGKEPGDMPLTTCPRDLWPARVDRLKHKLTWWTRHFVRWAAEHFAMLLLLTVFVAAAALLARKRISERRRMQRYQKAVDYVNSEFANHGDEADQDVLVIGGGGLTNAWAQQEGKKGGKTIF